MQYLLQILHLSCQVQRLHGYQAPWSVLLRNRMAECLLLPIGKGSLVIRLKGQCFIVVIIALFFSLLAVKKDWD